MKTKKLSKIRRDIEKEDRSLEGWSDIILRKDKSNVCVDCKVLTMDENQNQRSDKMLYNRDEPEWNAENMNKKIGDTTFINCGWCEHTSGGSVRYGCVLHSHCLLMKNYSDGVNWNTKCLFKSLSQTDLRDIISSKNYEISNLQHQIERLKDQVTFIKSDMSKHKNSPPLSNNRTEDYDEGEVVFVNLNEKWERGIVVSGYRSHDGCVSYVLDNYPESKKGWGCGVAVPVILKEWEYNYFKNNIKDYNIWRDKEESKKYNGEKIKLGEINKEE